jgi:hypothetical protein
MPGDHFLIEHFDHWLVIGAGMFVLSGEQNIVKFAEMGNWRFFESGEDLATAYGPMADLMDEEFKRQEAKRPE